MGISRRDFLAFIPSISAIPLIGKDIIQKSDRIEIIKPEQSKIISPHVNDFDLQSCELQLVQDGHVVAKGYVTTISMDNPMIDISVKDSMGFQHRMHCYLNMKVEGVMIELIPFT